MALAGGAFSPLFASLQFIAQFFISSLTRSLNKRELRADRNEDDDAITHLLPFLLTESFPFDVHSPSCLLYDQKIKHFF